MKKEKHTDIKKVDDASRDAMVHREHVHAEKKPRKFLVPTIIVVCLLVIAGGVGAYFGLIQKRLAPAANNTPQFGETNSEGTARKPYYSPLSGLETTKELSIRRPIAVMLGNDPVARPLSGLSKAEIIVEMPVLIDDITRLMPIYQINDPKEIGGIRSARHNFIDIANSFNALMVHWGGSFRALSYFQDGKIDHVDGINDGGAFYRVARKAAPYNGYSTFDKIRTQAESKGYDLSKSFSGYEFKDDAEEAVRPASGTLEIPYPGSEEVSYQYDTASNTYRRFNKGLAQKDEIDGTALAAKNIIVMRTTYSSLLGTQYLDVKVTGSGDCTLYQDGKSLPCTWKKSASDPHSALTFVDAKGKQLPLNRGQTWIEIVKTSYNVTWKSVAKAAETTK